MGSGDETAEKDLNENEDRQNRCRDAQACRSRQRQTPPRSPAASQTRPARIRLAVVRCRASLIGATAVMPG